MGYEIRYIYIHTKAFDTVCREALLYKLWKLGVQGRFFDCMEHMYNVHVQCTCTMYIVHVYITHVHCTFYMYIVHMYILQCTPILPRK